MADSDSDGRCVALLVVSDDAARASLSSALAPRFAEVISAGNVEAAVDAILALENCRVVVVDLAHIEGAVDIAIAARTMLPTPTVLVIAGDELERGDAFRLGGAGVKKLLRRPCRAAAVLQAVDAIEAAPDLLERVAPYVGRVPLFEFEKQVREAFVLQGVARMNDSRSGAARMLEVPRPIVQRVAPPRQAADPPEGD